MTTTVYIFQFVPRVTTDHPFSRIRNDLSMFVSNACILIRSLSAVMSSYIIEIILYLFCLYIIQTSFILHSQFIYTL